jgi:hypothetical protein
VVTLTGTVRSGAEKQQAGHAAWASLHVTAVNNGLLIRVLNLAQSNQKIDAARTCGSRRIARSSSGSRQDLRLY